MTQPALIVIAITMLSLVAIVAATIYYVPRVLTIEGHGHGHDHEPETVETEESEPTAGRPA